MSGKVWRTLAGSSMIPIGAKIGFIENLVSIENEEQLANFMIRTIRLRKVKLRNSENINILFSQLAY